MSGNPPPVPSSREKSENCGVIVRESVHLSCDESRGVPFPNFMANLRAPASEFLIMGVLDVGGKE